MRHSDFSAMVAKMAAELPREYFEGIAAVDVSEKSVPHPTRTEIYTMGECIPLPTGPEPGEEGVQSRIILYYGSFKSLSRIEPGFDWRGEAWETLTHELRHHLEWKARQGDLERFDQAAEQNFARMEFEPFDPLFYRDGERLAPGWYQVDDDRFHERLVRAVPSEVRFTWHGLEYRVAVPAHVTLPAFLTVEGVDDPPPGELVLVLRRK
ncbi:MAG TPA: metallopeptidase family protein, partial [Gemmatimonadales bacterium]|nr:metallopeptidase family protein [Gemmatimonadales bacterium]